MRGIKGEILISIQKEQVRTKLKTPNTAKFISVYLYKISESRGEFEGLYS